MSRAALQAPAPAPLPLGTSLLLFALMALAAAAALWLTPRLPEAGSAAALPRLDEAVPAQFGDWRLVPTLQDQVDLAIDADGARAIGQPYDRTLLRTYQNAQGEQIMLALAYARLQSQEIKVHRPEVCYAAVGYEVLALRSAPIALGLQSGAPVAGRRMLARDVHQTEAVSYWIRIGDIYSQDGWRTRWHLLTEGLQGRVRDGALVRASRVIADPAEAEAAHAQVEAFLAEMMAAMAPPARALFLL